MEHRIPWLRLFPVLLVLSAGPAHALPKFARQYGVGCQSCHSIPPRLNEFGQAFQANHFNWPGGEPPARSRDAAGVPVSGVAEFRHEDSHTEGKSSTRFRELLLFFADGIQTGKRGSGGYFLCVMAAGAGEESRTGSLEDAFVSLPVAGRRGQWALTVGQATPLMLQYWHHAQLVSSAPTALSLDGPVEAAEDSHREEEDGGHEEEHHVEAATIEGHGHRSAGSGFSFADHQPGVRLDYFSARGRGTADGDYFTLAVPFDGILAFHRDSRLGRAQGVFAHGFRRRGPNTLGAFAYGHGSDSLSGLIGTRALARDLHLLGVAAFGKEDAGSTRRLSLEGEYVVSPRLAVTARLDLLRGEREMSGTVMALTYYPLDLPILRLTLESTQQKGNRSIALLARGQF